MVKARGKAGRPAEKAPQNHVGLFLVRESSTSTSGGGGLEASFELATLPAANIAHKGTFHAPFLQTRRQCSTKPATIYATSCRP